MQSDFRSLANHHIQNLSPYQPGKPIEELERELGIKSPIKLASNENPLGPSKRAINILAASLNDLHIYPDGSCYHLKNSLANVLNVSPLQLTIGNGSENILELIIKSYLHPGDNAVISEYAFLTIPLLLESYGITAKVVKSREFGHDIPAMINAIDEKTRVIFIVNPNNPTGTYINKDEFDSLMQKVPKHVLVVLDEAYHEYMVQKDYPDSLNQLAHHSNLLITRTFSKIYGLAALRLGYSISSTDIADILNRARLPFNVNTLASKAGSEALFDIEHVQESIELNQKGLKQMTLAFKQMGVSYIPSVANFISIQVKNGYNIYQDLLRLGVIVRPLNAYGLPNYLRITIGTSEQNERFLTALQKLFIIKEKVLQL